MKHLLGKRVRMIYMEDVDPIQPGDAGIVNHVDDAGHLHVKWDSGRGLAIIPSVDQFEVLDALDLPQETLTQTFSLN